MALELKTNLFDIAKFALVGVIIAFLFFNYGKLTSWLDRPEQPNLVTPRIERLEEGLLLISAKASTARLEELIKQLKEEQSIALKAIRDSNEKVDQVTVVVTELKSEVKILQGDKYDDPDTDDPSTRDFADIVVKRRDAKGNELPMARVIYHPEIEEEPWTIQNFPLKLHTTILQVEEDDGTYKNYVETYFTNDFVKSSKGKKYYFDSEVEWAKRELKEKRFRWGLRLGFGGLLTLDDVAPGIDVSLASYGRTKRDMDWRFLVFGIGGNTSVIYGYIKPVEYNIGNFIPLVENLFLGPLVGMGTNGEKIFGVGLSVLF